MTGEDAGGRRSGGRQQGQRRVGAPCFPLPDPLSPESSLVNQNGAVSAGDRPVVHQSAPAGNCGTPFAALLCSSPAPV